MNVDVEQDFGVIAHKPDRDDEETEDAVCHRLTDEVAYIRANPRLRRSAGALIGETIPREPTTFGDAARSAGDFICVWIARFNDSRGQAVRGEDDLFIGVWCRRAQSLSERIEQQRMIEERMDRLDAHARWKGSCGSVEVLRYAERGELRGKRNPDDARHALRGKIVDRLFQERLPVAHADRDRYVRAKAARQRGALSKRQVGQRRPTANRLVVVTHFSDKLR